MDKALLVFVLIMFAVYVVVDVMEAKSHQEEHHDSTEIHLLKLEFEHTEEGNTFRIEFPVEELFYEGANVNEPFEIVDSKGEKWNFTVIEKRMINAGEHTHTEDCDH